jgi:hypothetical protein
MSTWTREQLEAISAADELEIATRRRDGTLRDPVTIWSVRLGDDLYVRSVNGPTAAWYRGAQTRHEARISAGGVEKDVSLVETTEASDEIDASYRAKYGRRYPAIVPSIIAPQARAATLKLEPRS